MSKQFKLIVLTNIVIAILFLVCNVIYNFFATNGHAAQWNPLWVTFYNIQARATIGDLGAQVPNFSLYFFWAAMIINIYFIFKTRSNQS